LFRSFSIRYRNAQTQLSTNVYHSAQFFQWKPGNINCTNTADTDQQHPLSRKANDRLKALASDCNALTDFSPLLPDNHTKFVYDPLAEVSCANYTKVGTSRTEDTQTS